MTRSVLRLVPAAVIAAGVAAGAYAATAPADTVEVPGNPLDNFDIGTIDSDTGRYYLADRSNSAVDIFDTRAKKFLSRVTGFVGVKIGANGRPQINISGPNGVAFDP